MSETYVEIPTTNFARVHDGPKAYGIVCIDEFGAWRVPDDLTGYSEEELEAALELTLDPPHPVDPWFGRQQMAAIREMLREALPGS